MQGRLCRKAAGTTAEHGTPSEHTAQPRLGHWCLWDGTSHGQAQRPAEPPHLPHTALPEIPAPSTSQSWDAFGEKTADAAKNSQYFIM